MLGYEYVMRGNSAILKCTIPSFVADFVYVVAWIDDEGNEIVASTDDESKWGKMQKMHNKTHSSESPNPTFILVILNFILNLVFKPWIWMFLLSREHNLRFGADR